MVEMESVFINKEMCNELNEKVSPTLLKLGLYGGSFKWWEKGTKYGGENGTCVVVFSDIKNLGIHIDNSTINYFDISRSNITDTVNLVFNNMKKGIALWGSDVKDVNLFEINNKRRTEEKRT